MTPCCKCRVQEKLPRGRYCRDCFNRWRRENRVHLRSQNIAAKKKWIQDNHEQHLARRRAYNKIHQLRNPLVWQLANLKRRAAGKLTQQDLIQLLTDAKFRCQKCKTEADLEFDHIKPVSKGGLTESSNMQVLCFSCDRSKGTMEVDYRGATDNEAR
jgi:5-methylcytosine-specific restriction endonuclease McrA